MANPVRFGTWVGCAQNLAAADHTGALFLGRAMKVKTFTGTHRFAVDRQVNDWLAKHKSNVAFKALRDRGWDAVAGKTTTRRALAIAITVWYDEPYHQTPKPNPATWISNPADSASTLSGKLERTLLRLACPSIEKVFKIIKTFSWRHRIDFSWPS